MFFKISVALPQTPIDVASYKGQHETVKVLNEYAEVCVSVRVMKVFVLSLDVFL